MQPFHRVRTATERVIGPSGRVMVVLLCMLLVWLFGFMACSKPSPLIWRELQRDLRARYPQVEVVTTSQLSVWLSDENRARPVLLDVRAREEFETSHIFKAKHLDLNRDILLQLKEWGLERTDPIVAYCSVGYRSAKAVNELKQLGFTNVKNLEGSIFKWANEGHPIYSGGYEVDAVHPYSSEWEVLLKQDMRRP